MLLVASVAGAGPKPAATESVTFFTNIAAYLLRSELNLDLLRLQVYPTSQYTPAVHRWLQVTANLYDATTNRVGADGLWFPTVFRPRFTNDGERIFICGFTEEDGANLLQTPVRSLANPADRAALQPDDCVYGIPLIIGARKGFPNFNEFAFASTFELARKLEIARASVSQPGMNGHLRMKYLLSLTNVVGVELWNSYTNAYSRSVDIFVAHEMSLCLTNDLGLTPRVLEQVNTQMVHVPADSWTGYRIGSTNSFFLPLLTNVAFLPHSTYLVGSRMLVPGEIAQFETGTGFFIPSWGFTSTNRLRVLLRDHETGRIIDYAHFDGLDAVRDLSEEVRTRGYQTDGRGQRWAGMWNTNRPPSVFVPFEGITNQIFASLGAFGINPPGTEWAVYGRFNVAAGQTIAAHIELFRMFYLGLPGNTNLVVQVPFTPVARYTQSRSWQANDPLVHHLTEDLVFPTPGNGVAPVFLNTPLPRPQNLGRVNDRFSPWGGNPERAGLGETESAANAFNPGLKDALVRRSDDWNFPAGEPLSLLMLGRVHRGTPWQTVHLKSTAVTASDWQNWLGYPDARDAIATTPARDARLVTLVHHLANTQPPGKLLSVNERDPAKWLATLDGITVLTNLGNGNFAPVIIRSNSAPAVRLVDAIQAARKERPQGRFDGVADLLTIPELSEASPWLDRSTPTALQREITDLAYETLLAQLLPRLRPDPLGRILPRAGGLTIRFTGLTGGPYAVQSSSDLQHWKTIGVHHAREGEIESSVTPNAPIQFFRAVLLPADKGQSLSGYPAGNRR